MGSVEWAPRYQVSREEIGKAALNEPASFDFSRFAGDSLRSFRLRYQLQFRDDLPHRHVIPVVLKQGNLMFDGDLRD